MTIRWMFALVVILHFALPGQTATLHVSKTGAGTDGLSWPTAFTAIGDAIDASTAGDEIWVASGTYNETLSLKEEVALYGGFVGTEITLIDRSMEFKPTIIDATGLGNRVVTVENADGTTLEGFVLTGGFVDGVSGLGGGIHYASCQRATLINCRIRGNDAFIGGGIYCTQSDLRVINCLISDNEADTCAGVYYKDNALPFQASLTNCTIVNNRARNISDGVYADESRVAIWNSILWGGTGLISHPRSSRVITGYTWVQHLSPRGVGDILEDPLFVDAANGNYFLQPNSPCIDAGTPDASYGDSCFPPGQGSSRNDMGFTGGPHNCRRLDLATLPTFTLTPTPTIPPTPTATPTITNTPTNTPLPVFATLYVDSAAPAAGDGSSWDSAFRSVHDALLASVSGDQVWVADGIYTGSFQLRDGVDLFGGFSGDEETHEFENRDWETNATIFAGDGSNESIFVGADDAILDGIVVQGGRASRGAGLYCNGVAMTIRNTLFSDNHCEDPQGPPSLGDGLSSSSLGGAIYAYRSNLSVRGCRFESNRCDSTVNGSSSSGLASGYASATGGAISVYTDSILRCEDSEFRNNSCHATANFIVSPPGTYSMNNGVAIARGGAVYSDYGSKVFLTNCLLTHNSIDGIGRGR